MGKESIESERMGKKRNRADRNEMYQNGTDRIESERMGKKRDGSEQIETGRNG